jgi:hypothetical protein
MDRRPFVQTFTAAATKIHRRLDALTVGRLQRWALSASVFAIVIAAASLLPGSSHAAECTCGHLSDLQAELRNALRLQEAFMAKIQGLRGMTPGSADIVFKNFQEREAYRGLEQVPGGEVREPPCHGVQVRRADGPD